MLHQKKRPSILVLECFAFRVEATELLSGLHFFEITTKSGQKGLLRFVKI
jgi:hypothetical protein